MQYLTIHSKTPTSHRQTVRAFVIARNRQKTPRENKRVSDDPKPAYRPLLCLDFDGVIHSYTSGWKGASIIPDPPVEGAMEFIWNASDHFRIAIFSSRSNQPGGMKAMILYVRHHFLEYWLGVGGKPVCEDKLASIEWPLEKPAAFVTLDDRAITFDGTWPSIETLKNFKPWNKK